MDRCGVFLSLCCCLLSLMYGSCSLEDERDLCCEANTMNYRFLYHGEDCFEDCIYRMNCYLFDSVGLYVRKMYPLRDDLSRVRLDSLSPGRYTMVALANLEDYGYLTSEAGKDLKNFRLEVDDYFGSTEAFNSGDPLYWGSCDFEIVAGGRNAFLTEMADVHCILRVRVEWERLPDYSDGYYYWLDGVSGVMSLCDDHSLHIGVQHFPVNFEGDHTVLQEVPLRNLALDASLYTLRYTNEQIPDFCLWNRGKPAMKLIELKRTFREWGWYPDRTAVQEYSVRMLIRADGTVEVSPGIDVGINDWVDGGTIGF